MLNWQIITKGAKYRFVIWAVVACLLLAYFVRLIFIGFPLNTNVMDLLPSGMQNPVAEEASQTFSKAMGNQVIFLIGNQDQEKAIQSADLFYKNLATGGALNGGAFHKIDYKMDASEQQAWASFYFPYRLNLLTSHQRQLLQENKADQIEQAALMNLYNPMGITNSELMQKDPFFLFQKYLTSLPKPASNINLHQNRLMVESGGLWYVMITGQLSGDSFSMSTQNQVVRLIEQSETAVKSTYSTTEFVQTGMLFYAKAGAENAEHDISTIGIGSLIGIILLMLLTFRSLSPLFFTIFSSAIGFVAAFVVTQMVFGTVYLFTLAFGASLIGISVDYAFFYYADQLLGGKKWHPMQGLRNIIMGISLGLLNIVLAYMVIAWTPFPGIQQLAVFAIVGLTMAFATVVCAFPLLLKAKQHTFAPPLLKLTNCYLTFWQKVSVKKIILLYVLILGVSIIGVLQLKTNDDIRILEGVPQHLKDNEAKLKQIIGSDIGTSFLVVAGGTPSETLENEVKVTDALSKAFSDQPHAYIAINSYLPSVKQQQQDYQLIQQKLIKPLLLPYLKTIGVPDAKAEEIQSTLASEAFKPLTIEDWVVSPVSKSMRFLWLGKINDQYATIILLSSKLMPSTLIKVVEAHSNATYINKADEISHVFESYRQKISVLLLVAFALLFILLVVRYGFKKAPLYLLPPVSACILSFAALGIFGIPLTLFNVLALILVLGISVDYILFFAETKSLYQSTMLAVTLSALTTVLAFGLLALSATPVIHFFGVTVLVGITASFLLSPLIVRLQSPKKDKLS